MGGGLEMGQSFIWRNRVGGRRRHGPPPLRRRIIRESRSTSSIPFVASGTADNVARLIAQRFSESSSQTVIVDDRTSSGSTIGREVVAKRRPTGAPARQHDQLRDCRGHGELPFDPIKDSVDHRAWLAAADAHHASVAARHEPQRVHRAREVEAGRSDFASSGVGHRHVSPPRRSSHGRHRPGPRAVQRHRRGDERVPRRAHEDLFRVGPGGAAARQGRKLAADRRHHREAPALSSRCADHRQVRLSRLRDQLVAEHVRPGRNTGGSITKVDSDSYGSSRWPRCTSRYRLEGADPVGGSSDPFAARVQSEIAKWSKVAKQAGIATSN